MSDQARLEKGKEMFKKAYGDVLPLPEKTTPYSEFSLKGLFAEVYSRDKISDRDRRLLILGALAGLGADPSLFEIHARSAVRNGEVKADELEEFLLVLVNYCGFPRVSPLLGVSHKVVAEESKK